MYFASNDRSQNTFFSQPTLDTLELKQDKGTDYVLSRQSNGLNNSKFKPLYTAFLHDIKLSGYKIGIKIDKNPLAVEQINYLTKIANVYIVYDLTTWPKIPLKHVTLKTCFFGATNIVNEKDKWVFSGYGIVFDGGDWWSFGNGTTRNVIIFGVDNSSSSYVDNLKNNFSILGKGLTFGINGNFGSLEK